MATVEKSVDVNVSVRTAYEQWTQFETFPHFMAGVEQVVVLDEKRLRWVAKVGDSVREWDAEIVERVPDQLVVWRAAGEVRHDGVVRLTPLGEERARVDLELAYDPDGDATAVDVVDRRVAGDLERFRTLVESRGAEAGAGHGLIR